MTVSMKIITFQDRECYVGYKGLDNNLRNFQGNYTYELNNWYEAAGVDPSYDKDYSFGLNACDTAISALIYGNKVFEAYVPIRNNKIVFVSVSDKFRFLRFYLSDKEIDFNVDWMEMPEYQQNRVCTNYHDFNIDKYWDKMLERQRNLICRYNPNIDIDKYWTKMTEIQRDLICTYNSNLDIDKYWDKMTEGQRLLIKRWYVHKIGKILKEG